MPEEEPPEESTGEEVWDALTNRPVPLGMAAAIHAAAQDKNHPLHDQLREALGVDEPKERHPVGFEELRDDLTEGIKKSKSSEYEEAFRRYVSDGRDPITDGIRDSKTTEYLDAFRRGPGSPASGRIRPTLPPSAVAATSMVETTRQVEASLRTYHPDVTVNPPTKPKKTDLPLWAKWAFGAAGLIGVALAAVRFFLF